MAQSIASPSPTRGRLAITGVQGLIRFRALVNFRVDAVEMQRRLPRPFRVRTVRGCALAGICLIRLERVRPSMLPHRVELGLSSDNVAYRVGVEWPDPVTGEVIRGVYIPRRDTNSRLQRSLGGRIFPGEYHYSDIRVDNDGPHLSVTVRSDDGLGDVRLVAMELQTRDGGFPPESVFTSLGEASRFFEEGAIGYSARRGSAELDGLLLTTDAWRVSSLHVRLIESSFFEFATDLMPGGAILDNAMIMRDTAHRWDALPSLRGG